MEFKITKLPKSQAEIFFEIPIIELEEFKKEAILNLGKNLRVEGFRPGKAPQDIAKREIGETAILQEAGELAIGKSYKDVIDSKNIIPISQPEVKIVKLAPASPFEFKITVSVMPEIKLPDYKKIASQSKRNKIFVGEKEFEDSLSWLQKSRAKFSLKNAPAEKGDFVDIEYSSLAIEAGKKYNDAFVLGDGRFLEGFEKNLEAMKDGQEKKFSVNFPKGYSPSFAEASAGKHKDLAAKEVEFNVKMKSVQKMEKPDINDEFARAMGDFEGADALKKSVKEGILIEKEKAESNRIRNEILEKVAEKTILEIPDVLIESEKARMLEEAKDRVAQGLNMEFNQYLQKINKSEKDLLDSFAAPAEKRVKFSLALREIAKNEKIESSDSEIQEETNNFLKNYPDIKSVKPQFDEGKLKEYIKEAIINEKTFKFLESLSKPL